MNPPITPAEMLTVYNTAAYWNDAYANYVDGEAVRVLNSRVRMASIASHLPGSGRWLDIGCATGSFSVVAKESGYDVIGVDPAAEMIRFGRERYGLDLRATTIEEFDAGPAVFDVVSLWGTDSHFYDVRETFAKIVRLLKPGGHFAFSYQDYDHWIRVLFPRIKQNVNVYYNFTRRSLRLFLKQLGLIVLDERMEIQVTQLRRVTRTIRIGEKLLSRWDGLQLRIPAMSFYTVVAKKL